MRVTLRANSLHTRKGSSGVMGGGGSGSKEMDSILRRNREERKRVLENWHSPWLCGQGPLASILEALKTPSDSSP